MASEIPPINIRDYQYELPQHRIADFPLENRDRSKLLVYRNGEVRHGSFIQLPDNLPDKSILFFNNTKVIHARILFRKETGAGIEIFLLHPAGPHEHMEASMKATGQAVWLCTVGNMKRWLEGGLTKNMGDVSLKVEWKDRKLGTITFSWTPAALSFEQVVNLAGEVPLPPYIKREADATDEDRYQTVYSRYAGAVAAPTAGLHFTPDTMDRIEKLGHSIDYVTLHVSAGTFLPVKAENAADHLMHEEEIIIYKSNIINMLHGIRHVVAVGTTALRTLESIYWYGVLLHQNPDAPFVISQYLPYQSDGPLPSREESLQKVLDRMTAEGKESLTGSTSIFVMPGYRMKIVNGLITNFHQPGSTLLLLVSALIGSGWKRVYQGALDNGYRFLSYGDSSLLLP